MADITFTQIESGIVTRLEAQISYVEARNIASYAGQIEDANNGLPVEAPAMFVMFDGFERDGDFSDVAQHVGRAGFSVLCVADSYVGGTQARTGTYGVYKMIDDVIAALDDHDLSLTGFPGLALEGVEMIRVDRLRSMYRVRFGATVVVTR